MFTIHPPDVDQMLCNLSEHGATHYPGCHTYSTEGAECLTHSHTL